MSSKPKPSVSRVYQDLDSEQAIANADALRSLKAHHGWRVLTEALQIQRDAVTDRLVKGGAKDHVTYAHWAGTLAGLEFAEDTVQEILDIAERMTRQLAAERGTED